MKINAYINKPSFGSVRQDRNTTAQLKQNNDYSLTEPNQRRINKAIENLAKQQGEENIKFLLNVGENLTYQTNIDNGKETKNDWKSKLKSAAQESLSHSDPILEVKYRPKIKQIFNDKKELSDDEKSVLKLKNSIIERADLNSLKSNSNENIKNLERNLEYFITSTETNTKQKKQVLEKLDYFMSPDYEINPQLKNKKTQVLAEIINDITVNTPESKIPNIKAVNQKSHGMCAAISIVRKAAAYEDKPNYVESVLSELDSSDKVMVYDRQNLGSGKKIPVKKAYIDFNYAQDKGYRIIDASTLQWMNIAGMYGVKNEEMHKFNAFDKENFDAFHDSFFLKNIPDENLAAKQKYYQALVKAKDEIGSVKSSKIKKSVLAHQQYQNREKNTETCAKYNEALRENVHGIVPSLSNEELRASAKVLLSLYKPTSEQLNKNPENIRKYSFIPNEEKSQKENKIKMYFTDKYGISAEDESLNRNSGKIVDYIENINNISNNNFKSNSLAKQSSEARRLYTAEAAYRASVTASLKDKDNLTEKMIEYKIPDDETRIVNGFERIIKSIETGKDEKLINYYADGFGIAPENKAAITEKLAKAKDSVDYMATKGFDGLYAAMGFGSRREVISGEINLIKDSIENDDKEEILRSAKYLGTKQDKETLLKEYDKLIERLENNPDDEKIYRETLDKLGYKNQTKLTADLFNTLVQAVTDGGNPESETYVKRFKKYSGLSEDATDAEVIAALNNIGRQINGLASSFDIAADLLEVPNEDGTPYFTVSAENLVLKKTEESGVLIPQKTMKKLQDRFTKIDKIRSQDEFSSRQGKISDPSLYKLSVEEKNAIKQINKKINFMYSDVARNLEKQYREIKEPLTKFVSDIGVDEGRYWISQEGQSGLYGDQEIKIFEQLTDRPYYENTDINDAVEKIKNGVHSGVSSSSVFHDRMGGHAQYIADIKENETNGKTVLYHDNTWGASEHENTWVDSDGLLRTDYSDRRGGELGYITDENWRNGNYVDNLTHKKGHTSGETVESKVYKKLNPSSGGGHDFELMSGIILQGDDPAYKDIAGSIKDAIYVPDSINIGTIRRHAEKMTKKQIQKAVFRNNTAGAGYREKYDKIMRRLNSSPFNKGIDSKDDYDKLPDNDPLKLAFEKAAVREAYKDAPMSKALTKVKNTSDIKRIKNTQRSFAKSNFEYAFGKTPDILMYPAVEHSKDIAGALLKAFKDNGLSVKPETAGRILKNICVYNNSEKQQFNGCLEDSINFVVNKAETQFEKNVKDTERTRKAKEQFSSDLKSLLEKDLYFNEDDLKSTSEKSERVRNWIDDKFNPSSDKEFVEIYKTLQNTNKEDFDKLTRDIDDKYLGIKDIKGYDMLVKVKAANSHAKSVLRNVLFYDEYVKDMDTSRAKRNFKYGKTERNSSGYVYTGERTFDDLYRTMKFSLSSLEYEKLFNKYRDENFRKYQAIPAYPKINLENNPALNDKIETTSKIVEQSIDTINAYKTVICDFELVNALNEYRAGIPEEQKLSADEYTVINKLASDFITNNYGDSSIENSLNAACEITKLDENSDISKYNKYIDIIVNEFDTINNTNNGEISKAQIKDISDKLKHYFNVLTETNFLPKHQPIIKKDINNWINAAMKSCSDLNGFDGDKNFFKLIGKIQKYGNEDDKKTKTEALAKITEEVSNARVMKAAGNSTREDLNAQIDKINSQVDDFVNNYAAKEHQREMKSAFEEYMNKEIRRKTPVSADGAETAKEKFEHDFRKYYITSYPTEILNNFLLSCASDADKSGKTDIYEQQLEAELDLAKFIDIQESLMEAVQTGNAAEVRKHFDEYYVYPDGDYAHPVGMNSDGSIDYMVRSLIMQDNTKTAEMFVEKLGLGDRVMEIEAGLIKKLKPEKKTDNIAKTINNHAALTDIISIEAAALNSTCDDDYVQKIDAAKRNIMEKSKGLSNKRIVKIYLKALDEAKKSIQENPDVSKQEIINQTLAKAAVISTDKINEKISQKQEYINAINLMYTFLSGLHLPEYSKGYAIQKELQKDYERFCDYNNTVLGQLADVNSFVGITAG